MRILDLIPIMTGPAYIQYYRTNGSTSAAATAEAEPKPQSMISYDKIDAHATKIAHYVETSDESILDFPNFLNLVTSDLQGGLVDAENRELLAASAGGEHGWDGLLHVSGTLGRVRGTETPLDTLEMAVNDLRVGPAFASPDAVVLNPTDWSAIRRAKDAQNRYLAVNPLDGSANTLWGIRVVQTSQIPAGTAVVANFMQGTLVYSVNTMRIDVDRGGDAFIKNVTRVRCEERLIFCVTRPSAVVVVTGL
ncbi:phage major capsid protein [Amycolatopsis sp. K13G38]|uniref:Phage major capsid protein n=1 Tax=Amycolatopsis acididurans TaxID=2724524 RepID=A0ABX1IXH0_9PSEU|nr:phage major capsid protein [Amycolatopsis acididurans]NKQ52144.1 phage major capsid protein [Amycolatopsis acididurans]